MIESNEELEYKNVYATVISKKSVGLALYLGRLPIKQIKLHHVIVFREKDKVKLYRFRKYSLENGKLKILRRKFSKNESVRDCLSSLEEKFIDKRLKKQGL